MKVVDTNVLLYAVNADTPHHEAAQEWLENSLNGTDTVGFTWIAINAFLRISTKAHIFTQPLDVATALETVRSWLSSPYAVLLEPAPNHFKILPELLAATGIGGSQVSDATIAAIARAHDADVLSYDRDFERFPGIRRLEPEQLLSS